MSEQKVIYWQDALELCLIGGNGLASGIIQSGLMPDSIKTFKEANERLEAGTISYVQYEMWQMWKCLMVAREALPELEEDGALRTKNALALLDPYRGEERR